ncbi:nicotinamidase-related amidase [Cytobacillus horneckiae]|uniref:cysteine hydrolase family protein n=2 Tax=Cytobacillus horneckiae TaxID=549687 RepID=UPI0019D1F812|nr:cysteine hydrolase family protein [Cytobacillus horneckiae]MBN6889506.1 cysteine hydrolase [Cytobacillus horneckiae]
MKTALLVIDVQNDMFQEGAAVYNGELLLEKITHLLDQARSTHTPVFYVQHKEGEGTPLAYGTESWAIHPQVLPSVEDIIIHKKTPDSFHETSLDEELKKQGIQHLILTGIQTEVCVDTTCRRAFSLGYKVTVVSDGHSTWNSAELTAKEIIHHHNQVLRLFANIFPLAEVRFE